MRMAAEIYTVIPVPVYPEHTTSHPRRQVFSAVKTSDLIPCSVVLKSNHTTWKPVHDMGMNSKLHLNGNVAGAGAQFPLTETFTQNYTLAGDVGRCVI
jgi:hypothetical protein